MIITFQAMKKNLLSTRPRLVPWAKARTKALGITLLVAAVISCIPVFASSPTADARLRAIYTEEWKWRREQFPNQEDPAKPIADHLPKEDPATQEIRLKYW